MGKMIVDDEIMRNVELLAQLSINEDEIGRAKRKMQQMLDYVEKLQEIDTEDVQAMSHIFPVFNVFREDEVVNGDDRDAMLANAPKEKEGQYVVPKTV